jgi:predicted ATPase/DNA-binding CsgD family transcriptional regulator
MQDNIIAIPAKHPAEPGNISKHHLPAQLTPLIGREQEVADLCALIRCPEVRLLTLTGTGGVGKTRLGLQVAAHLLEDFADGVYFVSLAPLSQPDLVLPTLAQTIDLKESSDWLPLEHLKSYLHEKQVLLLLDNFEQVITVAPLLVALLQACPALKLLVTSRDRLRVSGEHEFSVQPLAVPDPRHLSDHTALLEYTAVALFVQRAQAIKPTFQLTLGNARAIAECCLHLDGLPLAIELAAARIKLLSPQALLARLSHRLQVLTGGVQDAPVRQQTLRNTIAWSYDLLDAAEQRLFRRLSVFVAGCTLEAVEAICTALPNGVGQVLEGVSSLLDKGLLQQSEQESGEPRLRMLETLREYGLECLHESAEVETVQRAHADYYLHLAEEATPYLRGTEQAKWLARLEHEHENLRAALSFLLEGARMQAGTPQGQEQAEKSLRLCNALYWFWHTRGYYRESQAFLEQALALRSGVVAPVQARALLVAGYLALLQDYYERGETLCGESLALYRGLADSWGIAATLGLLGFLNWMKCQYVTARAHYEEATGLFQSLGDTWEVARCLYQRGRICKEQGEYEQARVLIEQSLELYQALGDQERIGIVLCHQASVLFVSQEDPTQAQALAEQSLAILKELGSMSCIPFALSLMGQMSLKQGEWTLARTRLAESLAIYQEIGNRGDTIDQLLYLGRVEVAQGDLAAAQHRYKECLALQRELNSWAWLPACLEGVAAIMVGKGNPLQAVKVWGAAASRREAMGVPMPPVDRADYEQAVAAARAQLGEAVFAAAWREGRTMTPEQALAGQEAVTSPPSTLAVAQSIMPTKPSPTYPADLTIREMEVLRLVAQGMTNPQIAERLILSFHTVNAHVRSIYTKLEVNSRSALTRYAIEHHLL